MSNTYIRGKILGTGTWGCVYQAKSVEDDSKLFAIKKIEAKHDGLDFTAIREVKYLQELKYGPLSHSIVQMEEVFVSGSSLHLVLEFCPFDLSKIIYTKTLPLNIQHIKCYMVQILKSLEHCHSHYILHRDLKPANYLIRSNGQLCLADFGLARNFASPAPMTSDVVTRWYKSPELLMGSNYTSYGIDIWASGCIFAEMFLREPLFPGNSDLDQLSYIFNVLGTPTEENWPNAHLLPKFIAFESRDSIVAKDEFGYINKSVATTVLERFNQEFDFLFKLLVLDPKKRLLARQALEESYLTSQLPLPCEPNELPLPNLNSQQ